MGNLPPPPPSSELSKAPRSTPSPPPPAQPRPFQPTAGIRRPRDTPTVLFGEGSIVAARKRPHERPATPHAASHGKQERRKRALTSPEALQADQRQNHIHLLRLQADRMEEELKHALRVKERAGQAAHNRPKEPAAGLNPDKADRDCRPRGARNKGKNRERHRSDLGSSGGSNDTLVPGYTASGAQLPIADSVIAIMRKGWTKHILLAMLIDEYCEKVARGQAASQTVAFNDRGAIQVVDQDVKDPNRDEHSLTFAQWDQAVARLLDLIQEFLCPRDHERWSQHFKI
ncbi:hypothetical protein FRC07_008886, partial [Ceratobasidium sp. 392]